MLRRLRGYLVTGLVALFPLVATYLTLSWLFRQVDALSQPLTRALTYLTFGEERAVPGLGILLGILLVLLIGLLTELAGRRMIQSIEAMVLRLPVVKNIYGLARNLTDALFGGQRQAFKTAALVEYPRRGTYTIAFVTGRIRSYYSLFIPTTPNPTSGWYLLVPEEDVVVLETPVDTALKLVISGGVIPLEEGAEGEVCAAIKQLAGRDCA